MTTSDTYYTEDKSSQHIFDLCLAAFLFIFKLLLKCFVYFPLLVTGYLVTTHILHKEDHGLVWITLIILFALIQYLFIFFLKGLIIGLKSRRNLLWVPLLLICVSYTSIAPVWLCFNTIENIVKHISKEHVTLLTWLFGILLSGYIYSKYKFLNNGFPVIAAPFYQAGMHLALL